MNQFEYKSVCYTSVKGSIFDKNNQDNFDSQLNQLGEEGWELVSTFPASMFDGKTHYFVSVLKRKK